MPLKTRRRDHQQTHCLVEQTLYLVMPMARLPTAGNHRGVYLELMKMSGWVAGGEGSAVNWAGMEGRDSHRQLLSLVLDISQASLGSCQSDGRAGSKP